MRLVDVIAEVRRLLQDTNTNADLQRYSDAFLLGLGNQTLKRIALLRPDLFAYIGAITCTAGSVLQSAPADSIRIMEIFQVQGGSGVRETNREILDQTYPAWVSETAGPCVSWMRHPRNANRFFIYPKAPVGQVLIGEYSQTPAEYAAVDTIALLSDAYFPVVVDGIIFLAESVDNEHVSSGRAQIFQQSFVQMLSSSLASRIATDTESAGLDKKELV